MAEFVMPSLGADMDAGTLLEWLVHPGDTVKRGQPMAVVDTDKAAVEIESFADGVVGELIVEPGQRVAVGTPLARLGHEASGAAGTGPAPTPSPPSPPSPPPSAVPTPGHPTPGHPAAGHPAATPPVRHHAAELGVDLATVTGTGTHGGITRSDVDRAAARAKARAEAPVAPAAPGPSGGRRTSPYARRLAADLGVDLATVAGTGEGGAVRADDVLAAAGRPAPATPVPATPVPAAPVPAAPEAAAPRAAAPETPAAPPPPAPVAGSASRATIAALMSRAKREIPHYYVATTVDLHAVTEWLRRTNRDRAVSDRVVPAAVLLKAVAVATSRFPELNGFWVDGGFVPADGVHLGVAVSVRHGALVAPALHDADTLDVETLMKSLRDLVSRARTGRLTRAEMADPTLTVTDLGDQGVEEVIGVIYPPQVALLGVGRTVERPWAVDGMLTVRPVVRLTLSGDHRATDGYTGARFLAAVDRLLQHPEEL